MIKCIMTMDDSPTIEGDIEMIEKGQDSGAAGWLVKPFQPGQLLWAIKRLIWLK